MKSVRLLAVLLGLLVISACATAPPRNPLADWRPSPNHEPRRARMVVIHHTAMRSAEGALLVLQTRNSGGRVSSHYLIGEDGRRYQLVAEQERAWHAGSSRWAGMDDINSISIGIELDNDGSEPFSDAQIGSLLELLADLTDRLGIQPHLVVGHGDVAPTKKDDPSVHFPWQRLAQAGYGLWPREAVGPAPAGFDAWAALRLVGYDLRDPQAALAAFHRHFRGRQDREWLEGDAAILHDLQLQLMELPQATAE
ncbi:N-acetylmuramoyl-L-alanine amidase [Lysobacter ciconiae]|uniref:N-acetylmuramoyl-L-alanine amidase n=1 Tax=Novilysobacter ciconiae TaxID=2781022 RepID=A0A7S6UFF4_9GAMM|nr:N-acetylmuramoyl-L-alanine amidase [Lysobacter ciconiae]QOW19315.1 N-acetylmuramoyl-L-alanine amidase [Lysobacter ciconiae]